MRPQFPLPSCQTTSPSSKTQNFHLTTNPQPLLHERHIIHSLTQTPSFPFFPDKQFPIHPHNRLKLLIQPPSQHSLTTLFLKTPPSPTIQHHPPILNRLKHILLKLLTPKTRLYHSSSSRLQAISRPRLSNLPRLTHKRQLKMKPLLYP